MTREQWEAEVLSWVGTPYRWHGRIKGDGADCFGLVVGAGRNMGYLPTEWDVAQYSRRDDLAAKAREIFPAHFTEAAKVDLQPGDIIAMMAERVVHLGILYRHRDNASHLGVVHMEDYQRIVAHGLPDHFVKMIGQVWRPKYDGE